MGLSALKNRARQKAAGELPNARLGPLTESLQELLRIRSTQGAADAVLRHPLGRLGVKLDAFGELAFLPGEPGLDPSSNEQVRGLDAHLDAAAVITFEGEPIEVHSNRRDQGPGTCTWPATREFDSTRYFPLARIDAVRRV
jgi:hypothetical protein